MKLRGWNKERRGGDKTVIKASWTDQMRRPKVVTLSVAEDDTGNGGVLLDMTNWQATHVLHGLAQIAWNMGWRPVGLDANISHLISNYKAPKQD